MRRKDFFGSIDTKKRILEISPNDNPIFKDIKYYGIVENKIKLDFTGELKDVPKDFDIVVSSHVAEHIPDFIEHINTVGNIVGSGGKYYLAFPDYRYCFDHYHAEDSVFDIIEAYLSERKKHTLSTLLKHHFLQAHNVASRHWAGDHGEKSDLNLEYARKIIEDYKSKQYIDSHAWHFSPDGMSNVFKVCNELGYLKCDFQIYHTEKNTFEMFILVTY